MNDYQKRNKFGGGEKGDRRGGNFGKKNFNNSHFGGDRARPELFQVTCATCGKTCEVPFRPNGKKPVYCKDCFDRNSGGGTSFAPRQEFKPRYNQDSRSEYKPEFRQERPQTNNDMSDIKRQIETLNSKIDTLVRLLTDKGPEVTEEPKIVAKKPTKKATSKKK